MSDYTKDLKIDIHNLHIEAHRQPEVFEKYSKLYRQSEKDVKILKLKLQRKKSLATKDLFMSSDKKPTVAQIESELSLNKDIQELEQELINKEYESNLLKDTISELHQKKDMICDLIKLFGMNYYSRVKEDVKKQVEKKIDVADKTRKKMKTRRNKK